MKKVQPISEAVANIEDGQTLMLGGFMGVGAPARIIDEIIKQGIRDLCLITSDTSTPDKGVGKIIAAGLARKVIASHIGTNPITQQLMIENKLEVELFPQGTLVEKIRSGGSGIGAFMVKTGLNTLVAEGKETYLLDGEEYLIEKAIRADHSLVSANQADQAGNLRYKLAARNFNPVMAMASDNVIAEVNELLPAGMLAPDDIHTPSCFVDVIVTD